MAGQKAAKWESKRVEPRAESWDVERVVSRAVARAVWLAAWWAD